MFFLFYRVLSPIVLGLLFYVTVMPVALLMRVLKLIYEIIARIGE